MRWGGLLVGTVLSACAASQPTTTVTAVRPTPEEYRAGVERSVRLGREIAAQDAASALASDVFQARVPAAARTGTRGWVALPRPDGWTVAFVSGEGESERVSCELDVPRQDRPDASQVTLRRMDPPRALAPDEAVRRRALQTVARSSPRGCGRPMNPVVLPASDAGQEGWFVYLLNSTSDPKELVVGGHLRFHVSQDGLRIDETLELSKCQIQPRAPGEQTGGLVLGTPFFQYPNEGHVFTAISQKLPLFLGTKLGPGRSELWQVTPSGEVQDRGEVRAPGSG